MKGARVPWWMLTVCISLAALGISVTLADPLGASLVLGVGALVAADRPVGVVLALLALASTVGQVLPSSVGAVTTAGAISAGLGLGLMARLASQRRAALVGSSATMTMVWLTLLLSLLMWLPSGMVRLVDTHGEVLLVDVVVQDATLGTRFLRHLPAWTYAPSPSVALHGLIPWFGCVTLFLLLLARASRGVQLERACWRLTQFLGLGLVVIGLIDGVWLFIGEVDLPSASALQMSMARLAGNDLSAEVVGTLDGGRLGLASRPLLDLLRVLLGGVFFSMGVGALREATPASARVGAEPLFPVAVGLLITSAFLMPGQTVRLGLTAAVILWAASWVTGHLMGPRARTPHDLMWGAVVVTCFTWLAPVAGWLDPGLGR